MTGVTLPSIDRMLAQIDRELEPPFRLPVGGMVTEFVWGCWADRFRPNHQMSYACGTVLTGPWEETQGLCAPCYLEIAGNDG